MKVKHVMASVVMVLCVQAAHSAPIVQQQLLDDGSSFGSFSSITGGNQYADNFSLGQDVAVTGFTWWGSYFDFNTGDNFTLRLFGDNGGAPTATADILDSNALSVSRSEVVGVTDFFGQQIYQYDVALDLSLMAGSYFVSVLNDADDEWYWADAANGDGANWFRVDAFDTWAETGEGFDLAFILSGDVTSVEVPEPSTPWLFMSGFMVLLIKRLRRQNCV